MGNTKITQQEDCQDYIKVNNWHELNYAFLEKFVSMLSQSLEFWGSTLIGQDPLWLYP